MENQVPEYIKADFGYVVSILHYSDKNELDPECMLEILKQFPQYGLGFNIEIRKRAYKVLEWCMTHPDTNFKELDSWYVSDNATFYEELCKLYNIMTEFRFYERSSDTRKIINT